MNFIKNLFKKEYKKHIEKIKEKYDKEIFEQRNRYISVLHHDIKTPLLAQIQTLELIMKNQFGDITEEQKEILNQILNSNIFLLEIVQNAIFLEKYENEKPKLKLENVDIKEEIEDCCQIIKNFASEKQQNIVLNIDKDVKLNADKKLIQKIIMNLLSSSVSCGFENTNIEISVKESKHSVSFFTKNKSVYMTSEKLHSLFEDKKSLTDLNQLGMNLNLNIAKKLIFAHNWNIIAKSNKDNSSTFGFVVRK